METTPMFRRRYSFQWAWALSYLIALSACSIADAATLKIDRVVLTVRDLARTEAFYRDGLGFKRVSIETHDGAGWAQLLGLQRPRHRALTMQLGDELVEFDAYENRGHTYPDDSHSPDRWFQHFAIIVSNMPDAYAHLLRHVRFKPISIGGPVTLPAENGAVQAFKFRDPDGHPLELLYFPPGQGQSRWHPASSESSKTPLFLGIDHSAIAVSNTPASLTFYAHLLGLQSVYAVVNRGPTQQSLDGTFNAVVEITGLRGASADGLGVEFLDYRTPVSGRPARLDVAANDIEHVHLRLVVDDLDPMSRYLFESRVPFVSAGVVEVPQYEGTRLHAAMVLDPDRHWLLLSEPSGAPQAP